MEKLFIPIVLKGGQPELQINENIIINAENVSIYDGDKKSQYINGVIYLTPQRIIWSNLKDIGLSLNHQLVLGIETLNTGFMSINSSPKILITLVQRSFRLSFHAGKRDEFLKSYSSILIQFRQQNKLNSNLISPTSMQQQQQQQTQQPPPTYQQHQQQQQNPFLMNQYQHQQQQNQYNQYQQQNNYNPYGNQALPPPTLAQQSQPILPPYMLSSINSSPPITNNYSPYQQPYLQQQQQQIPQYQQTQSPPNYTQHMQQHQSSSPPLHVNFNNYNQFNSLSSPPPPPSYQESIQQQRTSIYSGIPSNVPNQNLQNFINQNQQQQQQNKNLDNGFTSNAGIGGILKQMNKKTEENDKLLSEAFTDLNALMEKAKDMVTLSEKLKVTLDKKTNSSTSTGVDTNEEEEFRSFLMQMGIESPVTKKSAKSKYHNELSKQLSEWIINKNILKQSSSSGNNNNGMITLSDLYCIFNRARGIELISPDDLYRACLLFESLDLPLRLRKFDSGVIVVQSKDENDQQIAKEILNVIKEHGPISAFDLSKIQSISLNLAKEQLFNSEKIGILCRDETLQGILFHENIFISY